MSVFRLTRLYLHTGIDHVYKSANLLLIMMHENGNEMWDNKQLPISLNTPNGNK